MAVFCYYDWYPLLFTVSLGIFANGHHLLFPHEMQSSPSTITARKGSSIWLHWNYSYIGDGWHGRRIPFSTIYEEQIIGFSSTSVPRIQILAERIGQYGPLTLESPVPVPLNGRVEVISSNSTVAIHDIQYNDSTHQMSSNVSIRINIGAGMKTNLFPLKPVVSMTVIGIPDFIKHPPSTLEVGENSTLQVEILIDGNPRPSVDVKWSHLTKSSRVPCFQLYPFVYSSTYILNNVDASYCGRVLEITTANAIGSSVTKETMVTVHLHLDQSYNLMTERHAESNCVVAKWKRVESGKCHVRYSVTFRNSKGKRLDTAVGYNIERVKACGQNAYAATTEVRLTINFKANSRTVSAKVIGVQTNVLVRSTSHASFPTLHPSVQNTIRPKLTASSNDSEGISFQPENRKTPMIPVPTVKTDAGEKIAEAFILIGLICLMLLPSVIIGLIICMTK